MGTQVRPVSGASVARTAYSPLSQTRSLNVPHPAIDPTIPSAKLDVSSLIRSALAFSMRAACPDLGVHTIQGRPQNGLPTPGLDTASTRSNGDALASTARRVRDRHESITQ